MAKDVLEVLRRHVKDLHEGIRYGESIVDMELAVEAFAELIAADVEYDEDFLALNCETITSEERVREYFPKFYAARARRAAALAACRGLA